ncbi:MAG: pentapeptide repeat-containing protein [Cohaesibacter sp.]|jgi:uncharacterized protein YjbI with pentapeptide repeats|nr:pentapeptide repeat-containing protein [Cohaesibacter sp.]
MADQIFGNLFFQALALYLTLAAVALVVYRQVHTTKGWHLKAIRGFLPFFAPIWGSLLLGNIFLLWRVAETIYEKLGSDPELLRWYVLAFVGLMTTLGGVLGTPIALIRIFMTERQTKTAEESHVIDQINKAVEGLGTTRLVKQIGRNVTYSQNGRSQKFLEWHDNETSRSGIDMRAEDTKLESEPWKEFEVSVPNIEVRLGALGLLERVYRLSLHDRSRILRLLAAYIQENSPSKMAERAAPIWVPSEKADFSDRGNTSLWHWTRQLRTRADVSMALVLLATLRSIDSKDNDHVASRSQGWKFNLSDVALQAASCARLDLHGIRFQRSHLQGTDFKEANLKSSNFIEAKMTFTRLTGTNMREAQCCRAILKGAIFESTKLQGCDLSDADIQGALFQRAEFDTATNLGAASNRGSAFKSVDLKGIDVPREFLAAAFGDGSVTGLPVDMHAGEGDLAHWAKDELDWPEFNRRWRVWQKEIGNVSNSG